MTLPYEELWIPRLGIRFDFIHFMDGWESLKVFEQWILWHKHTIKKKKKNRNRIKEQIISAYYLIFISYFTHCIGFHWIEELSPNLFPHTLSRARFEENCFLCHAKNRTLLVSFRSKLDKVVSWAFICI